MSGAFAPIITGLVDALRPIPEAFRDPSRFRVLIGNLGWAVDAESLDLSPLVPVATDVQALLLTADALIADREAKRTDAATFTADLLEVLSDLLALVATLKDIDGSTIAGELADPVLWTALALDLPEYLLLRYLEANTPVVYASLRFAGVIQVEHPDETTPAGELPIDKRRLVWENLVALIADPAGYVAARYHWDDAPTPFDYVTFLEDLWLLAHGIGLRAELLSVRDTLASSFYDNRGPEDVRELVLPLYRAITAAGMVDLGVIVVPVPPSPGKDIDGMYVTNLTYSTGATSIDLGGGWTVTMSTELEESGVAGVRVRPSGADLPAVLPAAQIDLAIEGRPPEPWYILGAPDGTFLRVHGVRHAVRFADDADGPELVVELGTLPGADGETGVELAILPGEGDGFVHDLLGDMTLTAGMDLTGSWSSRDGLLIQSGGALLVTVPIQRSLGPVFLQSATIGIEMTEKGVSFEGSLSASVTLGPFVLVLDRVGLAGKPLPPADDGALVSFGELALGLAFKPPSGVGISCNTGVVSGGGFLNIDIEGGQYSGVVDLDILGVGLTAMGIVTTELPDGSDGWAMILSISTQFVPIQLGFGFTLNGVGGLVAVNRTLSASVLQDGLKDGSLDALLFPENAVAEAVRMLALLDTAFPIAEGQFTFGPIVEIGWGVPSLLTAQLGVIISLPDPLTIVVIGQFSAILPEPDRVLVELHLDVLGVLDFAAGTVSVDAVLRDSFIVGLVLAGGMAFRSSFLTAPSFLLSFGGFHPDFEAPDNVPDLARLSVALDLGDEIQVSARDLPRHYVEHVPDRSAALRRRPGREVHGGGRGGVQHPHLLQPLPLRGRRWLRRRGAYGRLDPLRCRPRAHFQRAQALARRRHGDLDLPRRRRRFPGRGQPGRGYRCRDDRRGRRGRWARRRLAARRGVDGARARCHRGYPPRHGRRRGHLGASRRINRGARAPGAAGGGIE